MRFREREGKEVNLGAARGVPMSRTRRRSADVLVCRWAALYEAKALSLSPQRGVGEPRTLRRRDLRGAGTY